MKKKMISQLSLHKEDQKLYNNMKHLFYRTQSSPEKYGKWMHQIEKSFNKTFICIILITENNVLLMSPNESESR